MECKGCREESRIYGIFWSMKSLYSLDGSRGGLGCPLMLGAQLKARSMIDVGVPGSFSWQTGSLAGSSRSSLISSFLDCALS